MLCQFLLYTEVSQLYVYLYTLLLGPPSPIQVTTEHRAELPVIYITWLYMLYVCIYFQYKVCDGLSMVISISLYYFHRHEIIGSEVMHLRAVMIHITTVVSRKMLPTQTPTSTTQACSSQCMFTKRNFHCLVLCLAYSSPQYAVAE